MIWLADNVVGSIPGVDELVESALPVVGEQGVWEKE